jgi:hypothetical protein
MGGAFSQAYEKLELLVHSEKLELLVYERSHSLLHV